MIVYTDSSVVSRRLLQEPGGLQGWETWERAASCGLLRVEVRRTINRGRLEGALDDERVAALIEALISFEEILDWVEIDDLLLARAGQPTATHLKTLDAIHLAAADAYREQLARPVVFATHDRQQALGARALGFEVIGVDA